MFLENLLMLLFWAFIGTQEALICRYTAGKAEKNNHLRLPVVMMMASVIIGNILAYLFPSADGPMSFGNAGWSAPQAEVAQTREAEETQEALQGEKETVKPDSTSADAGAPVHDGFILIRGGSFLMGSPNRNGSTGILIENFKKGAEEAGHTVETTAV